MKLIIGLVLLLLINLVNSYQIMIHSTFALFGDSCFNGGTSISINSCFKACGSQTTITYNLKKNKYILTQYGDANNCDTETHSIEEEFLCGDEPVSVNKYNISCGSPTIIMNFKVFDFIEESLGCNSTVSLFCKTIQCRDKSLDIFIESTNIIDGKYRLVAYDSKDGTCQNSTTFYSNEFTCGQEGEKVPIESYMSIICYSVDPNLSSSSSSSSSLLSSSSKSSSSDSKSSSSESSSDVSSSSTTKYSMLVFSSLVLFNLLI